MRTEYKELLARKRYKLVENINISTSFYTYLISCGIMDDDKVEEIKKNATSREQVNRILAYLSLLDDSALELFRRCLIETNQEHVLQILDSDDTAESHPTLASRVFLFGIINIVIEKVKGYYKEKVQGDRQQYIRLEIQEGEPRQTQRRIGYNLQDIQESRSPAVKLDQIFEPVKGDSQKPTHIFIKGRAGSGKTTLIKKILSEWVNGKLWVEKFKFVFCFEFRFLNKIKEKMTVPQFITRYQGPNLNKEEEEVMWKHIAEHPGDTLLVMDGLDEYGELDKDVVQTKAHNNNESLPLPVIIYNLLIGNLLQGVSYLITSRPASDGEVVLKQSFHKRLLVCGFRTSDIYAFVDSFSAERIALRKQIKSMLRTNTNILSLCQLPLICNFICECFSQVLSSGSLEDWQASPESATQLFVLLLTFLTLNRHPDFRHSPREWDEPFAVWDQVGDSITKLMQLALEGMRATPVSMVFSHGDIRKCMITGKELNFGILIQSKSISKNILKTTDNTYSFIHLLFQELLAALALVTCSWEEMHPFIQNSAHGQYNMVFMFLMAFWGDRKLEVFLQRVLPQSQLSRHDFADKANKLMIHLSSSIKKDREGKKLILNILYESQTPSLVDVVYKVVVAGGMNLFDSQLTSMEVKSLAFMLQHSSLTPTEIQYVEIYNN